MNDDIGSGLGCRLWSLGDHRQHTEMHENQNKRNPNRCQHPLITQLSLQYICEINVLFTQSWSC